MIDTEMSNKRVTLANVHDPSRGDHPESFGTLMREVVAMDNELINDEREVSWSRQHPSRTAPSRWRECNCRSHNNLQQDLADRRMANPMDPVLSHHTSQERQPTAVLPELRNNKPHQSQSVTQATSC